MSRGKSVNVFLLDGSPVGRMKCTIANWTGVAYRIPRTLLEDCFDREDLKRSGVYMLFGESESMEKPSAYIGQACVRKNGKGILQRLLEHKQNPRKDYWSEAVVFTTSNDSFGPTEISFLEHKFCNLALASNRYDVKNENEPSIGHVTEEKECELEEFTDFARIILGTLGIKILEPYDAGEPNLESPLLHLTRKIIELDTVVTASGRQTSDGFVVLKGSFVSPKSDDNISPKIKEMRESAEVDSERKLVRDMLFSSPSAAAIFVVGKSENGLTAWKTIDNKSIKDYES